MFDEIYSRFSELLTFKPIDGSTLTITTFGRLLFNKILPEDFPYIQASIRKPQMKKIIAEVITRYDKAVLRVFLDSIYVDKLNLLMDLRILIRTFGVLLFPMDRGAY